ncbi:ATP-binding cassette domain-containing protein [Streptomyces sp. NPDC001046]|uniref:ATP-binding cassette domain-containing protein n=1 Tax=Streptomyces sp. NPDC001046 TaxID=3364543 RepID=UPI0036AEF6AC
MIEAFGLTSKPRKELPPAADDVSFEARAGRVTALLGAPGAGKTTVLRLMLGLQHGRGITHFRGRPLHRIAHPSREVGVLLGDVPGHPARTVRGHLRMLCAAVGVPVRRSDEVLEAVGLVSLRDERLGTLSRGMDRRLGLACALLADPHTLVLDGPTAGLSVRESAWMHDTLRAHADQGCTVLFSTADPKEAARAADHVVTLERGRLVADQEAAEFARTRLRPRVAVRSPHAVRLATLLAKQARTAQRSVEVVREGGNRLSVYGSNCADIGEIAFRHGIVVHQLADEVGDMGPGAGGHGLPGGALPTPDDLRPDRPVTAEVLEPELAEPQPAVEAQPTAQQQPAPETRSAANQMPTSEVRPATDQQPLPAPQPASEQPTGPAAQPPTESPQARKVLQAGHPSPPGSVHGEQPPSTAATPAPEPHAARTPRPRMQLPPLPPPISVRPAPSPLRPLRYEIRRAAGVGTGFLTGAVVLVVSAVTTVVLARIGHTPQSRLLAAWPRELPLPPAALGAGLLGALAFGDEFRHPALAADRGTVPRRMGLLAAKLAVSSATALILAVLTVGCDAEVLYLVYGPELARVPEDWLALAAGWIGLVVGCAWAGVLAAGIFRSTSAGLAAVAAVPLLVVPVVHKLVTGPSVRTAAGLPARLREALLPRWPFGGERYLEAALGLVSQPVGGALTLSLATLLCAYLFTSLRSRLR